MKQLITVLSFGLMALGLLAFLLSIITNEPNISKESVFISGVIFVVGGVIALAISHLIKEHKP